MVRCRIGPIYFTSSGQTHLWENVAAALADRSHVVALDLRGHGDSERPIPASYCLADYAADVSAIATALALSLVVLVGHSLGALPTMMVAGEGSLAFRGVALPEGDR